MWFIKENRVRAYSPCESTIWLSIHDEFEGDAVLHPGNWRLEHRRGDHKHKATIRDMLCHSKMLLFTTWKFRRNCRDDYYTPPPYEPNNWLPEIWEGLKVE